MELGWVGMLNGGMIELRRLLLEGGLLEGEVLLEIRRVDVGLMGMLLGMLLQR